MNNQPIQPAYGSGQVLSPGATAVTTSITRGSKQVIVTNFGANACFMRFGATGIKDASPADYMVPAGAQIVLTKGQDDALVSHIAPFGNTTIHVICGEGY